MKLTPKLEVDPERSRGTLNTLYTCPERSRRTLNSLRTRDTLYTLLFYFSILIFIIGFNFTDSPMQSGWYQQFMPNIGNRQITDMTFLDSLTGYAVTNNLSVADTGYILKTTNGGNNWNFSFTINRGFTAIEFINLDTGYACGGSGGGTTYLCKTTNAGLSWFLVNSPSAAKWQDMDALSNDTLWLVDNDGLTGGVYRTTNGGASWDRQAAFNPNPARIYMFDRNLGFVCDNFFSYLRRTSNGGQNWSVIPGQSGFTDMYFVDSLTGWKTSMQKTTDGGFNWFSQTIPSGGNIFDNSVLKITKFSRDTIWGVGGGLIVGGSPPSRGILFRTTNGGTNWLFQLPDTSIHINKYFHGQFINNKIGWGYHLTTGGIHTTSGGNDTFYTPVKQTSSNAPKEFKLFNNYPNPFNPNTNIKYQIARLPDGKVNINYVKLDVFDVSGRLINTLVNQKQNPGEYIVEFDGTNLSSGIYFYSLFVDEKLIDTKKMILLK